VAKSLSVKRLQEASQTLVGSCLIRPIAGHEVKAIIARSSCKVVENRYRSFIGSMQIFKDYYWPVQESQNAAELGGNTSTRQKT
jgi:hypothetical protein